jgi:hypothetical protein
MSHHRHHIMTRNDFNEPWKLSMWRNPKKKVHVVGCAVCHPKKAITEKKVGRIHGLLLTEGERHHE